MIVVGFIIGFAAACAMIAAGVFAKRFYQRLGREPKVSARPFVKPDIVMLRRQAD